MPTEEKQHKQRVDTGPRLVPRDLAALKWIAQQYAVSLDHLCILLARLIEPGEYARSPKQPGSLTAKRAMGIVKRWETLGLIEKKWIIQGDPPWIWLTSEGLRMVREELGELRPYSPTPGKLNHLYHINLTRLIVESRRQDTKWRSEREIRSTQTLVIGKRPHTPDAIVETTNGGVIAIEVELTIKPYNYLEKILLELTLNVQYSTVWYFCKPRAATIVKHSLSKMSEAQRNKCAVYNLDEMRQNALEAATTPASTEQ